VYSTVRGFWPVEELAELANGPTGCGEEARGVCLFVWNLSVARSAVITREERKARPYMTLSLH
jgi:hypothetical protein